jgi:aldos-2-ulose dehydratase/isomerase family protein/VCBS repeat protein
MQRLFLTGLLASGLALSPAAAPADRPHAHASHFATHLVASGLRGGYMVAAVDINHDGKPDLVPVASQLRDLMWYENPSWTRHVIASGFTQLIYVAANDIDGDGIPELALAHGFTTNPATSAGIITILTHLGDPTNPWIAKEIDRMPTSHRIQWADIEGSGRKVLVDSPLVGPDGKAPDYRGPTPLVIYRSGSWKREQIATTEGLVHGILVNDWNRRGHEGILTAGFSGVHLDEFVEGTWRRSKIIAGDPAPWPKSGVSDITVLRLGGEKLLATIEPWHGNEIVVYRMDQGDWSRHVIDAEAIDSHTLVTADLDGRGRDTIIVGQRQGKRSIYLYSARDDKGNEWDKEELDPGAMAASGCAVADLNGDKRTDIVCISGAELKWYENLGSRTPRQP